MGCRSSVGVASGDAPVIQPSDDEPAGTDNDDRWLLRYLPKSPGPSNTPDEIAECFLQAVNRKGIELYSKQEEAILEVFGGSHVVLSTPTGSGKSLVAMSMLFKAVAEGRRAHLPRDGP